MLTGLGQGGGILSVIGLSGRRHFFFELSGTRHPASGIWYPASGIPHPDFGERLSV
jgi:hypothetical protein